MRDAPADRPEVVHAPVAASAFGIVEKPLSAWERVANVDAVRKAAILVALALIWEVYARWLNNPLLLPTFGATLEAFRDAIASGELPRKGLTSLRVLLTGYAAGIACAAVLTILAITTRVGNDLLELLTSMFNPLPAIALLPLALLWFGLGTGSIVFVLDPLGAVGGRAQHALRLPGGVADAAHGRPQLRPVRDAVRRADPDSRRPFRASSPASRSAGRSRGAR